MLAFSIRVSVPVLTMVGVPDAAAIPFNVRLPLPPIKAPLAPMVSVPVRLAGFALLFQRAPVSVTAPAPVVSRTDPMPLTVMFPATPIVPFRSMEEPVK